MEHTLSEDMIGEAWLLGRLRTGLRDRGAQMGEAVPVEEGPAIWEPSAREEWRPEEDGPCRVRVGPARVGGGHFGTTVPWAPFER